MNSVRGLELEFQGGGREFDGGVAAVKDGKGRPQSWGTEGCVTSSCEEAVRCVEDVLGAVEGSVEVRWEVESVVPAVGLEPTTCGL